MVIFFVFGFCAIMSWCCGCDSGINTIGGLALRVQLLNITASVLSDALWASSSVNVWLASVGMHME